MYTASLRGEQPVPPTDDEAAATLVRTVDERYDDLVALIDARLKATWSFERLILADRLVLLLGAAELLGSERGTGAVAGWTHLADLYGEPKSAGFINGVLAAILRTRGD